MAGVNNGFRQATLVVLGPYHLRGASCQLPSDPHEFKGLPKGSEVAIARFPRSCISDLYVRYLDLKIRHARRGFVKWPRASGVSASENHSWV